MNHTLPPAQAKKTAKIYWVIALCICGIFLIGNTVFAMFSLNQLVGTVELVNRNAGISLLVKELEIISKNIEIEQVTFLLTEDEQALKPINQVKNEIEKTFEQLAKKLKKSKKGKSRLIELRPLIYEKIHLLEKIIDLLKANKENKASTLLNQSNYVNLSEEIQQAMQEIETYRLELLNTLKQDAQNDRDSIIYTLMAGNTIATLILFLLYNLFKKAQKMETAYLATLEDHNQKLEQTVAERTQKLSEYSNELERSNSELEHFAFVASHDLQEPLRKIRAFGGRLIDRQDEEHFSDKTIDYLKLMNSASERMSNLINDLLTFSRVTTRAKSFETVALNQILDESLQNLEHIIERSQAAIEHCDLPIVQGDSSQLRQVFQNLISNSLKFQKPSSTPAIKISYNTVENTDGQTIHRFILSDNGIGFDHQHAEKIFTLFQRLHGKMQHSGTGIGLAICRKVIEHHKGNIYALGTDSDSIIRQSEQTLPGAIFVIELPA